MLEASPAIDEIIVMMNPGALHEIHGLLDDPRFAKLSRILPGGATRNDTTRLALDLLGDDPSTKVLFHDAVRPFLDEGFDIDDPALGGTATTPARPGSGTAVAARTLVEPLSDRELSVLRFLPSRMSNREIGTELFVSHNTVKSHLKAIYRKLGADGRDDAVRRARQHGLI